MAFSFPFCKFVRMKNRACYTDIAYGKDKKPKTDAHRLVYWHRMFKYCNYFQIIHGLPLAIYNGRYNRQIVD